MGCFIYLVNRLDASLKASYASCLVSLIVGSCNLKSFFGEWKTDFDR